MAYKALGKEIPAETVAALIMACVAIEDILDAGDITRDIIEELDQIQPELQRFAEMA